MEGFLAVVSLGLAFYLLLFIIPEYITELLTGKREKK